MRITRTLFLGAMIAGGAACGATTTASKVSVVVPTTEATFDEDAMLDEVVMDLVWDDLSASDRESMCWGRRNLNDTQLHLMVNTHAPEMDAEAFIAKLDKEC